MCLLDTRLLSRVSFYSVYCEPRHFSSSMGYSANGVFAFRTIAASIAKLVEFL